MKTPEKFAHGGAREGSGAKPKDPAAGSRVMWCGRLHRDSIAYLRDHKPANLSQAETIDAALALYRQQGEEAMSPR